MTAESKISIDIKITEAKILLVDDNPVNLQLLYQLLERPGLRLLVAKSGKAALTIAQKSYPDLILLDIMMPGLDGFEVCRRLKADPITRSIPIIFLSALDSTADKVKGLQLGAVDYVSKPFQAEEVLARVKTHLTLHKLSREVQTQRDKLVHELEVVSNLQRGLLPDELPNVSGLDLAVHYDTSLYAGGDYYDVVKLPDGSCVFLVADAEGHSAPAAVMMAMTCALFRSCPELHDKPEQVIDYINTNLCNVNQDSFVTAICAHYNSSSRTLKIARAGHPLPILYRPEIGIAKELACQGVFIMGIEEYQHVPVTTTTLVRGDRLLLYTDGVTERFNDRNQPYGEERICRQLENAQTDDPAAILAGLIDDLNQFSRGHTVDDDIAVLLAIIT